MSAPGDVFPAALLAVGVLAALHRARRTGVGQLVDVVGPAFKLTETPASVRRRAPLLGEHTDQVLGELGFDNGAVASLRVAGAVA